LEQFLHENSCGNSIAKALPPGGKGKVFCPECGKPILLRDVIEETRAREIREIREMKTA
jgi:uncharacterized Zn finger protein (UPF0148 family)